MDSADATDKAFFNTHIEGEYHSEMNDFAFIDARSSRKLTADFWIPFYCNSTNITHSRMEIHRSGYAW